MLSCVYFVCDSGKNNTAHVDVHRTDGKVADLIDEEALRASLGIDEKSTMVRAEPTTFFFDGTTLVLFVNVYTVRFFL